MAVAVVLLHVAADLLHITQDLPTRGEEEIFSDHLLKLPLRSPPGQPDDEENQGEPEDLKEHQLHDPPSGLC